MKTEMVYHEDFPTRTQAKLAIFEYLENLMQPQKRHSALGYLTPQEFEEMLNNKKQRLKSNIKN